MNYKRLTVIATLIAAAGIIPVANYATAQTAEAPSQTLEQRVVAIETYLHMSAVEKRESIVGDAKSVDDLKAAIIKLDREQDALDRKLSSSDPTKTGSTAERVTGDIADTKKEVEGMRVTLRSFEERIRKLEQRTR